jgi:hypothetical protein
VTVYGVIAAVKVGDKRVFRFTAPPPVKSGESEFLLEVLNTTAAQGWEVVTAGDFDADGDDEIILVHRGPFK